MKPVRLAPEAVAELDDAAAWYNSQRPGLGLELLGEFDALVPVIRARYSSFPRLLDTPAELSLRRALLPRFPYAAVFLELPREIRIVAIAHSKRHPKYWLSRIIR